MALNTVRVVELFAGVGGFALGLSQASDKFQTIWANQWEPGRKAQHAYHCYTHHFEHECINEDIADVKDQVPEHDLLVGGFPCQDYSVAATNAKGIEGKKGVLWWEIRDILERVQPPYVLLENVDRLLKSPAAQRGRDFGIILRCLDDLCYSVEWRVINAADYGHPQKRRRTFILACRTGSALHKRHQRLLEAAPEVVVSNDGVLARAFRVKPVYPQTSYGYRNAISGERDLVAFSQRFRYDFRNAGFMMDGKIWTFDVTPDYSGECTLLGDVLDDYADDSLFIPHEHVPEWRYMKGAKHERRVKPNGVEYHYTEGAIPFPDRLDSPGRTILTSESSKNRSTHVVEDRATSQYRLLSPEECERLNEFPVGWTATGMPRKFRYFVMGNALVVGVITTIAKALLDESCPNPNA